MKLSFHSLCRFLFSLTLKSFLTCWEIQFHDSLFGHVIQMLDDSSQRVSVSCDQDLLAGLDLGHDHVVPVGQRALDCQLEGLEHRELLGLRLLGITRVFDDDVVVRVLGVHGGWRDVEGTAPNLQIRMFLTLFLILIFFMFLQETICVLIRTHNFNIDVI